MENVLTEITDPNIMLETATIQQSYLAHKPSEKTAVEDKSKQPKIEDSKLISLIRINKERSS
jgi:hypothetical protein